MAVGVGLGQVALCGVGTPVAGAGVYMQVGVVGKVAVQVAVAGV